MWTRKELKERGKATMQANYWKAVLVALLLMALSGGAGSAGSAASVPGAVGSSAASDARDSYSGYDEYEMERVWHELESEGILDDSMPYELRRELRGRQGEVQDVARGAALGAVVGLGLFVAFVFVAIAIVVSVFLFNPLEVGAQRFFLRNLGERAEVKEVAFGYDHNYKEVIKTLFFRDLFVVLWSLLFIVPGIIKSYEYRMIPFLLADDPTMTKDRAFAESKRLMNGQKWNAFVLDLSFLGWNLLSLFTLGLLSVFYVAPYQCATNAALYERLRYDNPPLLESARLEDANIA